MKIKIMSLIAAIAVLLIAGVAGTKKYYLEVDQDNHYVNDILHFQKQITLYGQDVANKGDLSTLKMQMESYSASMGGSGSGFNTKGAYSSGTTYAAHDAVSYAGSLYVSLIDANTGNTPSSSPSAWQLTVSKGDTGSTGAQGPPGETGAQGPTGPAGAAGATGPAGANGIGYTPQGEYAAINTYAINDSVTYQGSLYASLISSNTGNTPGAPTSSDKWLLIVSKGDTGATGAQGPQGATGAQGATGPQGATGTGLALQGAWSSTTTYAVNDSVTYQGSLYASLQADNTNYAPSSNPSWWLKVVSKGDTGATGSQGPQGIQGETGPQGPQGTAGTNGSNGTNGVNAYVYIAYASDASGTGWSLTSSNSLKYRAEIHSTTALTPVESDFSSATWVKFIGDNGATGATGAAGSNGTNGATWSSGSGAPSGGNDGDYYLNTTSYDVFHKVSGSWGTAICNIKGADGTGGGSGGGSLGATESLTISSDTIITPSGNTYTATINYGLGSAVSINGSGISVNANNITFDTMPSGGLNIAYNTWTESPTGTYTAPAGVVIRMSNGTSTEDVTVTSIVTTVGTPEAVVHFSPAKTLTYSTGSTYQPFVDTVSNIATTNLADGSLLVLYPASGQTIKLTTAGNISTAVSALPATGTILQRKGSIWQVVSAGVTSGGGGSSDYSIQTLGTTGTLTINRNTSDKWLIPALTGNITIETSNFTNMKEILVDIVNGGSHTVTFPSNWDWGIAGSPTLKAAGIDRIKVSAIDYNSSTYYQAQLVYSVVNESEYLVLDMPLNGTNGSTTFIDSTGRHSSDITVQGNAAISTAQQHSGTGSLYVNADGGVDVDLGTDHPGAGAFTLEWYEKSTGDQGAVPMQFGDWAFWAVQFVTGNGMYLQTSGTYAIADHGGSNTNWLLNRMARDASGNCKYWKGGVLLYTWTNTTDFQYTTPTLHIGGYGSPGGNFSGYFQNVKLYKGLAKTNGN